MCVISEARTIDPSHQLDWERKIVQPAMRHDDVSKEVSEGWGYSAGVICMACCALVSFFFTLAMNAPLMAWIDAEAALPISTRNMCLIMMSLFAFIAPLVAMDLVAFTTQCELLLNVLNEIR